MAKRSNRRQGSEGPSIAVAYLRRSTDRQEQSIPDQKRAVEGYAADHNFRLVRFYVDDAISGTTATRRPAFQEMVADAGKADGSFQFVLVYDVKRFGRLDNDEAGYYRHILRTHGVEVRYVSENFNGDTTDDLLRPVKQWQARQESKDLSKVTIRGLLSRVEGGWWMGGTPPYGYDLEYLDDRSEFLFQLRFLQDGSREVLDREGSLTRVLGKGERVSTSKRDRTKLVPSSAERVDVVKRIFHMHTTEKRGYRAIADALNREGIPAPRGPGWSHIYSGQWTITTVRSLLMNPQYVGDLTWNRRTDARFYRVQDGRAVERRELRGPRLQANSEDDWIVIRDSHEPLITRATWETCKRARESRLSPEEQRGKSREAYVAWRGPRVKFLLSGLVRCGRCGGRYEGTTRSSGKRRKDGSKFKTPYYVCGSYMRRGRAACTLGSIKKDVLENAVVDVILEAFSPYHDSEGRENLRKEIEQAMAEFSPSSKEDLDKAMADADTIESKIGNVLDNLTPTNREASDRRIRVLEQQRLVCLRRITDLELLQSAVENKPLVVSEIAAFVASLEPWLRAGTQEQRIAAIHRTVEAVVVTSKAGSAELRLANMLPSIARGNLPEPRWTIPLRD